MRLTAGTSDEHLSLLTHLHPLASRLSSVIITTPQAVSLLDTSKSLSFTRKVSLPVVGLIENMSGYACPCCGDVAYLFGQGGGEEMCKREGLKFLGRVPIEANLVSLLDSTALMREGGKPDGMIVEGQEEHRFEVGRRYKETLSSKVFEGIAKQVVDLLQARALPPPTAGATDDDDGMEVGR